MSQDYLEIINMETTFENKCKILADLWITYRFHSAFKDFFDANDIGVPLAFMLQEGIVSERTELIDGFISETFTIFLHALGIKDLCFEELDDMLDASVIFDE